MRIVLWTVLISVSLQILIAIRIVVGLRETAEVAALKRISGNHVFYSDHRNHEAFPGQKKLFAGLKGRSNWDVEGLSLILVTDEDLKQISTHFPNLKFLWLDHSNATLNGLKYLRPCRDINDLNLTDSDLGDDAVEFVTETFPLESLTLDGALITDACGPAIAKAIETGKLRTVHVSRTEFSLDAVKELRARFVDKGVYIATEKDSFADGILGSIRWSDGSRSNRFQKNYQLGYRTVGDSKNIETYNSILLTRCALWWPPQNMRSKTGKFEFTLTLGKIEAKPVEVEYVDGRPSKTVIEFQMPVTQDEASRQ